MVALAAALAGALLAPRVEAVLQAGEPVDPYRRRADEVCAVAGHRDSSLPCPRRSARPHRAQRTARPPRAGIIWKFPCSGMSLRCKRVVALLSENPSYTASPRPSPTSRCRCTSFRPTRSTGWRTSGRRTGRRTRPSVAGGDDDKRPRKYVLDMFPYPSGDLHMGHAEAYALGDVIARYWRQQGFNVLHPIGWDSFGLPAENAAIKRGLDPRGWTNDNIAQQKASMRRYAPSFDWDRVLQTSDPAYYRWNQWLFLKLYEKGLAYRKASQVNWCPFDQTVLANEQVVNGRCERCDNLVDQEEADPVVLPHHRLRGPPAGRPEPARGRLAVQGHRDAAQLDRALDRRRRRLRDRGPRRAGHRLHDPPRHAVRRDVHGGRARLRPGRRAGRRMRRRRCRKRFDDYLDAGARHHRDGPPEQPSARRPASSWSGTRSTR